MVPFIFYKKPCINLKSVEKGQNKKKCKVLYGSVAQKALDHPVYFYNRGFSKSGLTTFDSSFKSIRAMFKIRILKTSKVMSID